MLICFNFSYLEKYLVLIYLSFYFIVAPGACARDKFVVCPGFEG